MAATLDGTLEVTVYGGRGLLPQDGETSDPYVIVRAGSHNFKTSTKKKTLEPEWDDASRTIGPFAGVEKIEVVVMDWDRFGGNDAMGSAEIEVSSLPEGQVFDEWVALTMPEDYEGEAESAGEIHVALTFTATVVPEDEVPVQLDVVDVEGEEAIARTPDEEGELFHGPLKLAMMQRMLASVNLPFLNHDQEKKLYYTLLKQVGALIPMTALSYVAKCIGAVVPDQLVPNIFSDELKQKVVSGFDAMFDIPFVSEETERKMFATAYIAAKGIIRTDMALFTNVVASIKHLYRFRLANGEADPDA